MRVTYQYCNDRYEKEGDLAREGFVHIINVMSENYDDLCEVDEWCKENIRNKWLMHSGGESFSDGSPSFYFRMYYLSDLQDVFLMRLFVE